MLGSEEWCGQQFFGKTLHTSFGNIGPSAATVAGAFGKVVFIKFLCCDSALHAGPLEWEGLLKKHISLTTCLPTAFVSGCWGYSLGLFFVVVLLLLVCFFFFLADISQEVVSSSYYYSFSSFCLFFLLPFLLLLSVFFCLSPLVFLLLLFPLCGFYVFFPVHRQIGWALLVDYFDVHRDRLGMCSLQQSSCLEAGFRPPPSQVIYIYISLSICTSVLVPLMPGLKSILLVVPLYCSWSSWLGLTATVLEAAVNPEYWGESERCRGCVNEVRM